VQVAAGRGPVTQDSLDAVYDELCAYFAVDIELLIDNYEDRLEVDPQGVAQRLQDLATAAAGG
jgi:hypothetical protein